MTDKDSGRLRKLNENDTRTATGSKVSMYQKCLHSKTYV